jgi:hypothetical protein
MNLNWVRPVPYIRDVAFVRSSLELAADLLNLLQDSVPVFCTLKHILYHMTELAISKHEYFPTIGNDFIAARPINTYLEPGYFDGLFGSVASPSSKNAASSCRKNGGIAPCEKADPLFRTARCAA